MKLFKNVFISSNICTDPKIEKYKTKGILAKIYIFINVTFYKIYFIMIHYVS